MEITKEMIERAEKNLLFKRYVDVGIKESLFSDVAGALGYMHNQLVKCAYPELIGRKIIAVRETKEPMEKFPINSKAVAYSYAEGAITRLSGKANEVVSVGTDITAEASEEFTKEFVEDATWNVMENIVEKASKALGEEETRKVLSLYAGVAGEDLAGGEPIDQNGEMMDYDAIVKLRNAVRSEHWRPKVLVMNETQLHQLLYDDKFIEYDSLPASQVDLDQGLIRQIIGMDVQTSTLVPNGTAYAIDTRVAGIMLIRRDVTIEDWSDPAVGKYGVRATTRFGLGILRSNAIAKIVDIETSL